MIHAKYNCSSIILSHLQDMSARSREDFEIDESQRKKFANLIGGCKKMEQIYPCSIFRYMDKPANPDGYVEMIFRGEMALAPKEYNQFMDLISNADYMNISVSPLGEDWIQITFFVKDLWKPKSTQYLSAIE